MGGLGPLTLFSSLVFPCPNSKTMGDYFRPGTRPQGEFAFPYLAYVLPKRARVFQYLVRDYLLPYISCLKSICM